MSESLRILFDLQACQTNGSAFRGVGGYSSSLFEEVASISGSREVLALTSMHLPHSYIPQNVGINQVIDVPMLPEWHSKRSYSGGEQDFLDGIALAALSQDVKPDIIHISHPFEGFDERVGLFDPSLRAQGQIISATLYDLIPLIFQEHYFQNREFRSWYYARLAWLRKADLLLAISESSRQDAINMLGIEPWRISTVYGGIADHFIPPGDKEQARQRLRARFSIRERIVLYTGGDDYRKNIKGVIRAFAKLEQRLKNNVLLVVVCSMQPERKKMYLNFAYECGLKADDILITGFIDNQDLVDFYGICDVFVFPSLYEGLGLPVLEAMACGAPVVGGNNSSVCELIRRDDALFDASDDNDIANHIAQVLQDDDFADDLRRYGLQRAAEFSWERTAELAISAFDEAVSRARHSGVQCAINGWMSRKRLAVLSPLPPCKSGIADYNAQFLPFLARYFEIDLFVEGYVISDEVVNSQFRIFDSKDFEHVAASYDLILYELGNSEFHAYMLALMEKYPGVVGLHDAYLSGLFWYLDFHMGDTGRYTNEMLNAHGPLARRYFAPVQKYMDPIGATIIDLPCTKQVLDKALGVISHSGFNLDLARSYYPEGWLAPYRIIPQMVIIPEQASDHERRIIKKELGFQEDDFIVASFGHVAWTKCGDQLLDAFLSSELKNNSKTHLVFIGALAEDDFGLRLNKAIRKADMGKRVRITGYQTVEDYHKYLKVVDLAFQLRIKSRGGTPKGVLDCLAYGVPVVVNNEASYTDYPGDAVIKIDPDPKTESIIDALEYLFAHPDELQSYSNSGRRYVGEAHDPEKSAAAYATALNEFYSREQVLQNDVLVEALAPHIAGSADPENDAREAAGWLKERSSVKPKWRRRRLIVDVSHVVHEDHSTGIQRVVKEIVSALYTTRITGFDPIAVELRDDGLHEVCDWLLSNGLLAPNEPLEARMYPVRFERGDILLMLDSSWARYTDFYPVFERAREVQVPIITVVYDLIPIILPEYFVEGGAEWFETWFRNAVESSDGMLCISRSTADEVIDYVKKKCKDKKELKIGYWHLGSDFNEVGNDCVLADNVVKEPYLLVVGTIEPRKSHALILDSMEMLWANGIGINLCIAGKEGWLVDELMRRIREHPELGRRLFFLDGPSDTEVSALYANAAGLLFLSVGEGFGLPLVEAARFGIPIICSDIPVFREIAGEYATYVCLDDAQSVSEDIIRWLELEELEMLPDTNMIPALTWEESAEQLLHVVFEGHWFWEKQ